MDNRNSMTLVVYYTKETVLYAIMKHWINFDPSITKIKLK